MKKLLLMALLCLGGSRAWADDVTVTTGSALWSTYGTWTSLMESGNWGTTWQSTNGKVSVTSNTTGYLNVKSSQIATTDVTIWTPGDDMITGFSLTFTSNAAADCKITCGTTSVTSSGTSDSKTISVSGVYAHYVKFTVATNYANVSEFTISYSTLPTKSATGLYLIKANWPSNNYLYANSENAAKIWKKTVEDASTLYYDANNVWRVDEYGDYRTLYNIGSSRYVSNFTAANSTSDSQNGSNVNLLNATEVSDAEVFTLTDRTSVLTGAYAYKAGSKINNCWLDTWKSDDNYVGFHNSEHQGNPFVLTRVYKVTFKTADSEGYEAAGDGVPVNGHTVDAIYVPAGTTLSTVSGSKYFIDRTEKTEEEVKTAISEVTDDNLVVYVTPLPTTVTINFKQDDATIATKELSVIMGREYDIVSALGFQSRYMSVTPATVTGTTADQTIDVETTFTLPFNVSAAPATDESMNNVYYFNLSGYYAKGNQLTSSIDYEDKDFFWTFGGDYINGFTLYNKGQAGYMANGTTDNAVASFVETPTRYFLYSNTNDGFYLRVGGTDFNWLNYRDGNLSTWLYDGEGAGHGLDYYVANGYASNFTGSYIYVKSVYTDLSEVYIYLQQRLIGTSFGKYHSGNYTADDRSTALTNATTAGNGGNAYTVAASAKTLWAIKNGMAINTPYAGQFVYLKSYNNSRYAKAVDTTDSNVQMQTSEGNPTIDNIFAFVGNKFVSYSKGRYITATRDMAALGTDGCTFEFTESDQPGRYYIKGGDNYMYAYASDNDNVGKLDRYSTTSGVEANCRWSIEEVTSLPVTISAVKYATLWSPAALTIPEGVTAYVAEDKGDYLTLTDIKGGVIPAKTGVILYADVDVATTYNFAITTGGSAGDNVLTGQAAAQTRPEGSYILATGTVNGESGVVGFFGDGASTIPGFKAYLPSGEGTVKAFRFGTETAIDDIVNGKAANGEWYNLAGQRISKPARGLYIMNGKKVIVK